jgi:hypothetical protein
VEEEVKNLNENFHLKLFLLFIFVSLQIRKAESNENKRFDQGDEHSTFLENLFENLKS